MRLYPESVYSDGYDPCIEQWAAEQAEDWAAEQTARIARWAGVQDEAVTLAMHDAYSKAQLDELGDLPF